MFDQNNFFNSLILIFSENQISPQKKLNVSQLNGIEWFIKKSPHAKADGRFIKLRLRT